MPGTKGSSRGTMSMRKSNWSDLLSALAMSARDRVRRLLESATMNARAVISAMKTFVSRPKKNNQRTRKWGEGREEMGGVSVLSHALQNRMGAGRDTVKAMKGKLRDRQTIGRNHLRKIEGVMGRYKREKQKGAPLRPGRSS